MIIEYLWDAVGPSHVSCPAVAAEDLFFFLDKKEAKNQVGRKASLPHRAFALQIR